MTSNFKFEKVSKFADTDFVMPVRATACSAGYDMVAAEDIVVPSYKKLRYTLEHSVAAKEPITLDEMAGITKSLDVRPTLVSTGVKAYMPEDYYLKLVVRSSTPMKYWLIMGNSEGIIDADYADNSKNEGEIFFQLINLSPFDLIIRKGEKIGQGIFCKYEVTEDDAAAGDRTGGFGSSGK